jgi:hypothetical protein
VTYDPARLQDCQRQGMMHLEGLGLGGVTGPEMVSESKKKEACMKRRKNNPDMAENIGRWSLYLI